MLKVDRDEQLRRKKCGFCLMAQLYVMENDHKMV
jgi:hypothetical protein